MTNHLGRAGLGAVFALACHIGCASEALEDGGVDAGLSCEQSARLWADEVANASEGLVDCTRDDDCVFVDSSLRCAAGASLSTCGTAAAARDADEVRARFAVAGARVCALAPASCASGSACAPMVGRCRAGACRLE